MPVSSGAAHAVSRTQMPIPRSTPHRAGMHDRTVSTLDGLGEQQHTHRDAKTDAIPVSIAAVSECLGGHLLAYQVSGINDSP